MNPLAHSSRPRRQFLWEMGAGFAGVALASLLEQEGYAASAPAPSTFPKPPSLPKRAKSCIFLFMFGGPSQLDLFDYKPELQRRDGQTIDNEFRRNTKTKAVLQASRRQFRQQGRSGLWCSDAFPRISRHMDKLAVIKSLYSDSFAHGSAVLQMNSGRILQGHPSIGAWMSYGLGTLNQSLPAYVVMLDPRGGPTTGPPNWSSGYMPAVHQGTILRAAGEPILNLRPPGGKSRAMQRKEIDFINELNAAHQATHPGYSELQARISSYELAFRLQSAAPEALDLGQEDAATLEMYGINEPKPAWHTFAQGPAPFGRQCLIARRLVERGVRFVQLYSGGGAAGGQNTWDGHQGIEENLKIHCPEVDRPIAALLTDLERRGLLDETLVVWGGEFGRMPVAETFNTGGKPGGRDHNPKGFTYWMAGAGVKAGTSYGETDELGEGAAVDRHHLRDLHATILHLMGLDPQRLTYFFGGLNNRLTGVVEAEVIRGVVA
ncbi:MAG: DUF1501 domain-containing protein [Verrucomicrobia bacterium]|nr:DUF1501 domain-containing protein [Verrucomicrobiota bacterium]MBI3869568.1 DUF1501 domain-containing protein [Verrucomicrobiota bacterium]